MSDRSFERRLTSAMTEDVGQAPDWLLGAVLEQTASVRPMPAALALVAARPMALPARVVVGVSRRRLVLLAAAALLVTGGLIALALLQRPPILGDAWSTHGGSPARVASGVTAPAGVPVRRWAFQAEGPIDQTPVIVGELVLVTDRDGVLYAIDAVTGRERWRFTVDPLPGGPATDGHLVYLADAGGSVYALRLHGGSVAWASRGVGADPSVALAIVDGVVYAGTAGGEVVAIETSNGNVRWRATAGDGPPGSGAAVRGIAVDGGFVAAATTARELVSLRRDTGALAWTAPLDAVEPGVPTIADGTVWAGPGSDSTTGTLGAYDLQTGGERWRVDLPLNAASVSGDAAVAGSGIGVVVGLDPATGAERWRFGPGGWFPQVAAVGDLALVLSHTQRHVYGLDLATGARRWQLPLDADPGCCLAVAKGLLVVGTNRGSVTAFEGSDVPVASPEPSAGTASPSPAPSASAGASPVASPVTSPESSAGASPVPFPIGVTGSFVVDPTGAAKPIGVAIAPSGDVYVADTTHRVSRFLPDGTLIDRWGSQGDGDLEFDFSVDSGLGARASIAVGPGGLVYVSDSGNHRIQAFMPDGDFVTAFGSLGSEPGQFTIPFDVGVDAAGDVYVLDDGAQRVTKFSPGGDVLWAVDPTTDPRLLGHPHTAAFDSEGRLVVAIDDSQTIVRLDPATGAVLEVTPGPGCESVVDGWDRIYTVDCVSGVPALLDPNGNVLATGRDLQLATMRLLPDGRGVAVTTDGEVLLLEVTPP